ncbi:MAG: alpha/beta hydrolase [Pseudomonadota bacterium]
MPCFPGADGRRLYFADSGAPGSGGGLAVLCLAGLSRNHRDFEALAAHLARRHRVIRLDSRGRGLSERAIDPAVEYSIAVETGDALALIAHLGLSRLAIVGTSRGGILGMGIAAARPDLVAALVLNDVGAVIARAGLMRIADYLGVAPPPDFEAAAAALRLANAESFPGIPPDAWLRFARQIYDDRDGRPVLSYDPALRDTVQAALAATEGDVSLWQLFEALSACPMLVLRGANSDILCAETVAQMAQRRPGLTHVEIADRGHAPFLDEAVALMAIDRVLAAAS